MLFANFSNPQVFSVYPSNNNSRPLLKIENIPSAQNSTLNSEAKPQSASQTNGMVNYSIQTINTYNFELNNKSRQYSILINNTVDGQVIYFKVNQSIQQPININLFDSSIASNNVTNLITYFPTSQLLSNNTYAEIEVNRAPYWKFNVSLNDNFFNETNNISVTFFFPSSGFGFESAINILTNQSLVNYNALFPFQTLYFEISLENNRRVDFTINEESPFILENSQIQFYQWDSLSSTQTLVGDPPVVEGPGSYGYSWVSIGSDVGVGNFWIEVKLDSSLTGNFSLSFNFQNSGYSLSSAIPLSLNSTLIVNQQYRDRYVQNEFFKFSVNQQDIKIIFSALSNDPLVIANSKFRIYYERIENLINEINEVLSSSEGSVNSSFLPQKQGTYYIEYIPAYLAPIGSWSLSVSYIVLPTFVWPFQFLLFTIFYFLVIPIIIFYFKMKNEHEEIKEWEINKNYIDFFKTISKNQRLNPKMEVPFQKILLQRKNFLVKDIIFDIVPMHLDSEVDQGNSMVQTSFGLRYKKTIDATISSSIIILLSFFWLINVVLYQLFQLTLLPYRVTDLNSIDDIIFYLILPITIILLIIYFYNESYINSIINEIEYSTNESNPTKVLNSVKNGFLDNENLLKNLAYVRVLWNQAVKAFNEKNYSLFVIRADNSVKKLIETRFQQLIGSIDEKLEFNDLIEAIRNQGFDVPSNKKIEYFRKIRNKVVHSSHLLDEKSAIETFNYYSKFLGRLGLRT